MTSHMRQQAGFAYHGPDAIRAAVGFDDLIDPVARALVDFSRGLGDSPASVFAPAGDHGDVHVKSAWLPGRPIFTVKVATWFAARMVAGGSAGSGIIAVFDARTGDLRALLDDQHHLSSIRTAAAGALAARTLARRDAATIAVLGTGVQAYLQALAAAAERPVRAVRVWGRTPERARRLVEALRVRRPDLATTIASTARDACTDADVLVTTTASTEPIVQANWLTPGLHITAVGADAPTKVELAPGCLARADRVVVDSRSLNGTHGDIAFARAAGIDCSPPVELGDVLADRVAGRTDDRQITICKLVGLGVQDLAAAEVALERLSDVHVPARSPASHRDLGYD